METAATTTDQPHPAPLPSTDRARPFPLWRRVRPVWPAAVATLLLLGLVFVAVREIKALENGRFVYTIDDGYFHMAVAKNMLRHGIWGISAIDGFSSGTSSLLWPLVIAASFAVFGFHEYFPFVLNLLAAVGLLFYAGQIVRRVTGSGLLSLLVLVAMVVLTPLVAVASTGMEHCLQALLSVIFVDLAARLLTADAQRLTSRAAPVGLCVVGALLVMTRYEGLFLVAPVGLLLLCQRRWLLAAAVGITAAAPVVLFGLLAVSKGWYFLPNSLLIKGNSHLALNLAGLLTYFQKWYAALQVDPHMFSLLAALTAALLGSLQRRWTLWTYPAVFLFVTLLATLQHLQFAGIGWFYRYEAYLIVLTLIGIGTALGSTLSEIDRTYWRSFRATPHYVALALATVLFGTPLWTRAVTAFHHVPTASYNIYEQQYQMGHFVRRYYGGKGVMANDVGAVSYFGEASIADVVGLADINILRARRAGVGGNYDHAVLRRLAEDHHVELVMVYDSWNETWGGALPEWVEIGQWRIRHNTIVGSDTVSFYAPSAEFVPVLTRQLQEFGATLPKDIIQGGSYRGTQSLQALGTYGPEGEANSQVYWTGSIAKFMVYPSKNTPLGSDDTTLRLSVLPVGPGQTMDVFFNDRQVATQKIPQGGPIGWVCFAIKARWHEGANVLWLKGHGTPVYPPHDGRPFLFRVLDPRQMMDDTGKVTPQLDFKSDES